MPEDSSPETHLSYNIAVIQPVNDLGQPVGRPVDGWTPRAVPPRTPMEARLSIVVPIDVSLHAKELYLASLDDPDGRSWTYLSDGPFSTFDAYQRWLSRLSEREDPMVHVVIDRRSGAAVGIAAFLRIDPSHGVIEVGHIHYTPLLRKSAAATEAMALMMSRVFDELGYRRYEWKCDSLNAPPRKAASRLGFTFEGVFRQAVVYKGRNRDTAWYSILDREWPSMREAFTRWLAPENFDESGRQRQRLKEFVKPIPMME